MGATDDQWHRSVVNLAFSEGGSATSQFTIRDSQRAVEFQSSSSRVDRQSTEKDRSFQENYVQVSAEMTEIYYSDFSEEDIIAFLSYLRR